MLNIKELRKLAKEQGFKCTSNMNTITLCKLLCIPHVKNEKFEKYHRHTIRNPVRIVFKSTVGNKEIEFHSISNAAVHINKNPSCIPFYIKRDSTITYQGGLWKVLRKD